MAKAMNDDEVLSEMTKMVAFIKQEAMEKAREVKVKADEEFSIEKGKIVRQESINIDATYERKRKQVEVQRKIATSNQTNKARLRLLNAREEYLEQVFDEGRNRVSGLSSDKGKYQTLLKDLTLQALYAMMEKQIILQCRKKDVDIVNAAIGDAKKEFEEKSKFSVDIQVQPELSDESAGGVKLSNPSGNIIIDNTVDERLRLLEEKMLPELRTALFGENPNRKFYN
ncbi:ATPase V1 A1 complex subunit E [Atractiella rhizophila]|nr:ATPase V1 A1 complex subunit E [Atractiella rhizophila]